MTGTEQSANFFMELEVFSDRFVAKYCGFPSAISPWGSSRTYKVGPLGSIIHYTADSSITRVLKWFSDPKYQSGCSAHVVVARDKIDGCEELCSDLPLVAELPVTVVQTRRPDQQAWHATWCNSSCYGIENVNAGEVRVNGDGGGWVSWRPRDKSSQDWTMPWGNAKSNVTYRYGRYWEDYTRGQIEANIAVLRHVRDFFGDTLQPPCIIGHEGVQGRRTRRNKGSPNLLGTDKRDPGPLYPIHDVRAEVFDGWRSTSRYEWDPQMDRPYRMVMGVAMQIAEFDERDCSVLSMGVARARYRSALKALCVNGGKFGLWGKLTLRLLGYYVSGFDGDRFSPELDMYDRHSVWLFQRLMGLATDGYPGKITCAALRERIKDRRIIDE